MTAAEGSRSCFTCRNNEYASHDGTTCNLCPASDGVVCEEGILTPQPGYWIPRNALTSTFQSPSQNATAFDSHTTIFKCLREESCQASEKGLAYSAAVSSSNTNTSLLRDQLPPLPTPSNAYKCADGHIGVLCAVCNHTARYYFKGNRCESCDKVYATSGEKLAFALVGAAILITAAVIILVKHRSSHILRLLKKMKHGDRMEIQKYSTQQFISTGTSRIGYVIINTL